MSGHDSAIFLGDFIRAFGRLAPADGATVRAIMGLLGLAESAPEKREPSIPFPDSFPEPIAGARPDEPTPPPPPPADESDLTLILEEAGEAAQSDQPQVTSLRLPAGEASEPPTFEPLLLPLWSRGIWGAALATDAGEGPLDVERLVEKLAVGEPVTRWPKIPWPTLSRGVQVLVDKGEGMLPFARDQRWALDEIQRVAGRENARVLRFAGCPSRGAGEGPRDKWKSYQPPAPGTPVLLLTDLGIARPMLQPDRATPAEWLGFASLLRKANCPLLALVPYERARCPAPLRDVFTIIRWDRVTSVVNVRNMIGRAHKVSV